jgi:hypothetical protein
MFVKSTRATLRSFRDQLVKLRTESGVAALNGQMPMLASVSFRRYGRPSSV